MYQPLAPCIACRRHVRTADARCPFCRAELEVAVVEAARALDPGVRLSRAVTFVAALAIAGCHSEPVPTAIAKDPASAKPSAAPTPEPAPTPSPGPSPGLGPGLVDDPGSPVAEYGAPAPPLPTAPPAKPKPSTPPKPKPAPGEVDDHGGMHAKYGAPPPPTTSPL